MAVTRQIFEEAFGASNRDQIYALALRFANVARLVGLPLTPCGLDRSLRKVAPRCANKCHEIKCEDIVCQRVLYHQLPSQSASLCAGLFLWQAFSLKLMLADK